MLRYYGGVYTLYAIPFFSIQVNDNGIKIFLAYSLPGGDLNENNK